MSEHSFEYKLGQLDSRMKAVESDMRGVKESVDTLVTTLTKGRGVFIGLLIAATSLGASAEKIINTIKGWFAT